MKLYNYISFYLNWPEIFQAVNGKSVERDFADIFHAVISSTIKNMSSTIKGLFSSTIKGLFSSAIFFVNSTIKRFSISTINEFTPAI